VVKNVAGYDLPKLVPGRLAPRRNYASCVSRPSAFPGHTRSFSISAADGVEMQQFVLAVQNSKLAHTSCNPIFRMALSRFLTFCLKH